MRDARYIANRLHGGDMIAYKVKGGIVMEAFCALTKGRAAVKAARLTNK